MKQEIREEPSGSAAGRQEAVACQALAIIVMAMAGASAVFLLLVFQMSVTRQQRLPQPISPSSALLGLFYALGLLCLAGSALWTRGRVGNRPSLTQAMFSQQIFIGIGLAEVSEVLGLIWFFLGGTSVQAVPLIGGSGLVILLFSLPTVTKRAAALKRRA